MSATHPEPAAPRHLARRATAGLLLCLLAPLAWAATLDVPFLRSTGAAAWMLLIVALVLSGTAARSDRRMRTRILFAVQCAFFVFFCWGAFGFARMPEAPRAHEVARVDDFRLLDQNEKPVVLSEELRRGPVLLVFYRGHW